MSIAQEPVSQSYFCRTRYNTLKYRSPVSSLTVLGYFWKVLVTNFLAKVAQTFGNFLGYFEKCNFVSLTSVLIFWATFYSTVGIFRVKFTLYLYLYDEHYIPNVHFKFIVHLKV